MNEFNLEKVDVEKTLESNIPGLYDQLKSKLLS